MYICIYKHDIVIHHPVEVPELHKAMIVGESDWSSPMSEVCT